MSLLVFQKHFSVFLLLFAPSVGFMRVYLPLIPHGDSTHCFSPISNQLQREAVACKDVDAIPPRTQSHHHRLPACAVNSCVRLDPKQKQRCTQLNRGLCLVGKCLSSPTRRPQYFSCLTEESLLSGCN